MKSNELYNEINENLIERYELVIDRIYDIKNETTVDGKYLDYFREVGEYLMLLHKILELSKKDILKNLSIEELKEINDKIYGYVKDNKYESTYLDPDYCVNKIGEEYGRYLSSLYYDIFKLSESAFCGRMEKILIYAELFVCIYNIFESEELSVSGVKDTMYWFVHDNSEIISEYSIREMVDPAFEFASWIIKNEDLSKEKYLYLYGEYISDNELRTFKLINSFSDEKINSIARTYTNGYIEGFRLAGKDLSKKGTVEIRYPLGFEKVVKAAIEQFREIGLEPVIRSLSYSSTSADKQMAYDHRFDLGLVFDKCIKDRKIEVIRNAFEKYKELASKYAGPAVIETFGELPFSPKSKKTAVKYDEKQQKLDVDFKNENMQVICQYIRPEERSFTIIAYPVSEIGPLYEDIFEDTIKINNLDQDLYRRIQGDIINVLDKGKYIHIKGMNGNRTDLNVMMNDINNPEKETLFENCVADVNIPVGEVFTSPKLTGTNGILHVKSVYLKGLRYDDLSLEFNDGCIKDYICSNFQTEEENKTYIKENLLQNQDTLPMGEFAIGTNTTAYVIGRKYDIVNVMPILIVEKMGPHFAVGDTCYSHEEDEKTFNPDGKEIVGKVNEISINKKYFNCHTDITIPYDELGEITVVTVEGERISIIKDGRFILNGTESLNVPFRE